MTPVFAFDVLLAAIDSPDVIQKILACLGLPTRAPPIAPAIPDKDARTLWWTERPICSAIRWACVPKPYPATWFRRKMRLQSKSRHRSRQNASYQQLMKSLRGNQRQPEQMPDSRNGSQYFLSLFRIECFGFCSEGIGQRRTSGICFALKDRQFRPRDLIYWQVADPIKWWIPIAGIPCSHS